MNLRARLSERVHIEDIREVLHFIQDDERLREEIYQLIFDEDAIVSYQALWVCTHFSKADVAWLSRKQEELIDAAMTCPHSGKRRMILNLICQQPAADPPRVDFPRFLHGTHDIPRGTTGRTIALHETGLSTDTLHPGTTTGTTHNTGNHGARLTGSRYPFRTKKHPESHESKEKQIISIAFISPFN